LFVAHGPPEHIRSDNGPEFTAQIVHDWLGRIGVNTLSIEPASPWENGYNESFNGKLRDELLRHYGASAPSLRLVEVGRLWLQWGMAEPLVIQMLKQKRAEISGVIAAYQAKIAQAKHDLAQFNASIRLFERGEQERAQYIVSLGFFKKGEIADICVRHLKADGKLDTRQLAERVMCARIKFATLSPYGFQLYKIGEA